MVSSERPIGDPLCAEGRDFYITRSEEDKKVKNLFLHFCRRSDFSVDKALVWVGLLFGVGWLVGAVIPFFRRPMFYLKRSKTAWVFSLTFSIIMIIIGLSIGLS